MEDRGGNSGCGIIKVREVGMLNGGSGMLKIGDRVGGGLLVWKVEKTICGVCVGLMGIWGVWK